MDSDTLRSSIEKISPQKSVCLSKETPIREVIDAMKKERVGCIFITENRRLAGIISERDLLTKVVAPNLNVDETVAHQIMTRDVECLYNDDDIAFALNRMHVGGFRHIPLVDSELRPTCMISVRDILGYLVKNIAATN